MLALGYESEGVSQFRTLHDQQLGFDCEFVSGKVCGDLHCVPPRSARPELIFLDSNCSQPATWILFKEGAGVGEWVSFERELSECPGQVFDRETFEIAEEVYPESSNGPRPEVFQLQGTSCVTAWPPAKSVPAVNRLIPHADSELAAAKPLSLDVGGGLHLSRIIGEDGLELTVGLTNDAGKACSVQPNGKCIPQNGDANGSFPLTTRVRQGSGATHVDLFTSPPVTGRVAVPVAHYPEALDFLDDAGNRCQVLPALDGTLRCATLTLGESGLYVYQSDFWKDDACTDPVLFAHPGDVPISSLRFAECTDSGALTAVSTVKGYYGPVYTTTEGQCSSAVSGDWSVVWLTLDQRIEASDMPLVAATTL